MSNEWLPFESYKSEFDRLVHRLDRRGFRGADVEEIVSETLYAVWLTEKRGSVRNRLGLVSRILKGKIADKTRDRQRLLLRADFDNFVDQKGGNDCNDSVAEDDRRPPSFLQAIVRLLCEERPALAARILAIPANGRSLSTKGRHCERRQVQLFKDWVKKKEAKPGEGTSVFQKQVQHALDDFRDVEILIFGVPFNWPGPMETYESFYKEYFGSSRAATLQFRLGTFLLESCQRKAGQGTPVKITYVTRVNEFWSKSSSMTRDWCKQLARQWGFRLKDDPQRLRFLADTGYETISVWSAGRNKCKKV
jgi:DNA-directed RNA polymerase specialized sigma24 family protein